MISRMDQYDKKRDEEKRGRKMKLCIECNESTKQWHAFKRNMIMSGKYKGQYKMEEFYSCENKQCSQWRNK
jgi:hypothetical protein